MGILALAAALASAQTRSSPPGVNTIVAQMMAAQRANKIYPRAFSVKRDYQLLDKQYDEKAQVVATITFLPPDQKQYQIESSHGGMGQKILRDVLDKETETSRNEKEAARRELSPENYEFNLEASQTID